jgi:hypothetical protein
MRALVSAFVLALIAVATVGSPAAAQAQTLTTEVDVTGGYSSEDRVNAIAAQLRVFGEAKAGIRFNVEGTWARRSEDDTDAFGAAYPYGGRVQVSEAYAERMFYRGSRLAGIRLGQYRTPFGIYNRSDHAYSGFLRAPLIRYDAYWALTNNFLERGVDVIVGTPRLSVEASLAVPGDLGTHQRRSGLNRVVRAQGYYRALIVGASHINTAPYGAAKYAAGRMDFNGVDARVTLDGVQFRGEFLHGQPWKGPTTNGWYVDAIVHRRFMGPVTAVLRTEQLDYQSPVPFSDHDESGYTGWHGRRATVGGRVRLPGGFTAQVNVIRQSSELAEYGRTALDMALTYSVRSR